MEIHVNEISFRRLDFDAETCHKVLLGITQFHWLQQLRFIAKGKRHNHERPGETHFEAHAVGTVYLCPWTLSKEVSSQTPSWLPSVRKRQPGGNPRYFRASGHHSARCSVWRGTKKSGSLDSVC